MNKLLFGLIGVLLLGVLMTGALALRGPEEPETVPVALDEATSTPVSEATTSIPVLPVASKPPVPVTTPKPVVTPAPIPTQQPGTYTMAQVATHNSSASCYTAINGSVYDVTSFIHKHPGGASAILSLCGKDGTSAFEDQHGGQSRPASELASFKIGALVS